jgi:hypothetical protein
MKRLLCFLGIHRYRSTSSGGVAVPHGNAYIVYGEVRCTRCEKSKTVAFT